MKKWLPILLILCLLTACAPRQQTGDKTVSITVDCLACLDDPSAVPEAKKELIAPDGILLQKTITFSEGDNAYDVLLQALKDEKLHFEVDPTKYFLAVGNLYAGDCGELSGWMYQVNGESPSVGASQYVLSDGDELRLYYVTTMEW